MSLFGIWGEERKNDSLPNVVERGIQQGVEGAQGGIPPNLPVPREDDFTPQKNPPRLPGRIEDTAEAIKALLDAYPELKPVFIDSLDPEGIQRRAIELEGIKARNDRAMESWKAWRAIKQESIRANVAGQAALAQTIYLSTQPNVGTVNAYNQATTNLMQSMYAGKPTPVSTRLGFLPMYGQGGGGLGKLGKLGGTST